MLNITTLYKALLLPCVLASLPIPNLHINSSCRHFPSLLSGHIAEVYYLNKYSFEILRNIFIA
jgi:hypothetical protein